MNHSRLRTEARFFIFWESSQLLYTCTHSSSLFCLLLYPFRTFSQKVRKGSKVRPQRLQKTLTRIPRGAKPKIEQSSSKDLLNAENKLNFRHGCQNEAPGGSLEPQGPPKCKKDSVPQSAVRSKKQRSSHRHKLPSNQKTNRNTNQPSTE